MSFGLGGWGRARGACPWMFGRRRPAGGAQPLLFVKSFPSRWMQEYSALEQWKSRLPVGVPFDEFDFGVETLNHSITVGFGTSICHGCFIVSQPLNEADEFRDPCFRARQLSTAPSVAPLAAFVGAAGKCLTKWTDLALKHGRLHSIMSDFSSVTQGIGSRSSLLGL